MRRVCRFGRRHRSWRADRGRKKKNCSMASCKPPAATVPESFTLRGRPRTGGQPIYQAAGIPAIRDDAQSREGQAGPGRPEPKKLLRTFGWQRHFRLCNAWECRRPYIVKF